MIPLEPLGVARLVTDALDTLEVRWLIGGSVASSFYGEPRMTLDVDLVADLSVRHVDALIEEFSQSFHIDRDDLRDAVDRSSSTNFIHIASALKVDLFVIERTSEARAQLDRRVRITLELSDNTRYPVWVYSPEDVIVRKLWWSKLAGGSDRQRRDVIGVIRSRRNQIDLDLLTEIAGHFDVSSELREILSSLEN